MGDIITSIDNKQIGEIIYSNNHLNLWRNFKPQNCHVIESEYYTLVNSNISLSIQNGVTNFKITDYLSEKHIIEAIDYFREYHLPFVWLVSDFQRSESLINRLTHYGLNFVGTQPGMALDLNSEYLILNPPSDLSFSIVKNEEDLKAFAAVTCQGFGLPKEKCFTFITGFPSNNPNFNMIIGKYENEPVCVGIVAFKNGVASIHNITTVPDMRESGFGTSMTLKLLREAKKKGYKIVTLHSSEMAHNIYHGIGFMNFTKLYTFEYQVTS